MKKLFLSFFPVLFVLLTFTFSAQAQSGSKLWGSFEDRLKDPYNEKWNLNGDLKSDVQTLNETKDEASILATALDAGCRVTVGSLMLSEGMAIKGGADLLARLTSRLLIGSGVALMGSGVLLIALHPSSVNADGLSLNEIHFWNVVTLNERRHALLRSPDNPILMRDLIQSHLTISKTLKQPQPEIDALKRLMKEANTMVSSLQDKALNMKDAQARAYFKEAESVQREMNQQHLREKIIDALKEKNKQPTLAQAANK